MNVAIPDATWFRLADHAEQAGARIADVLAQAFDWVLAGAPTEVVEVKRRVEVPVEIDLYDQRTTHVVHLIKHGFSDQEIAEWVRVPLVAVRAYRNKTEQGVI